MPAEVLILSKDKYHKYFAVCDKEGNLLPHFITICNIKSCDFSQVVAGNERVISPRLSDAEFFWHMARKKPLAERREKLKTIVFQNQLGTIHDKSARVARLAVTIAKKIGGDSELTERAALLAKCDLVTRMVGEFPDLQGIIGRYYALLDGERNEVAEALNEQYLPRFTGDKLPQTKIGQAVSLAEKIDTLVGLFGIGQQPTGVKDPFALRRTALGIIRIIIENDLNIDLVDLLDEAYRGLDELLGEDKATARLMRYFYDRLRGYVADQGVKADVFASVLAVQPTKPIDFMKRLKAVGAFCELEEAESLASGNKRICNILRKNYGDDYGMAIDVRLLQEGAEQELARKLTDMATTVKSLMATGDYIAVLTYLASISESVNIFFDEVMVMVDDKLIRQNRLALLNQVRTLFLGVADISYLH